ncbi:hypothetical protein HanRHA438_Chr12g0545831 [Helianthus annuus]|nr:hypothetical protein HanPSC8_Chr12g0540401 [Helianthus annuus]KAJ0865907.1 hypothetical protein HanRHA438_Chr12g0545831 [Helianthus annuus]
MPSPSLAILGFQLLILPLRLVSVPPCSCNCRPVDLCFLPTHKSMGPISKSIRQESRCLLQLTE